MDGVIVINKEKGFSSHDIVNKLRKILNTKKVGHAGTLDPNATGVLVVLVGAGTKLSKFLIEHDKTYIATIKLGEKRNTKDEEGEIIEEKEINRSTLKKENVKNVLSSFIGKQMQVPPIYSAIKVKGKKLYEYALNNEKVEIEPREINIYDIELIGLKEDEIKFSVHCSKGTYIRSLCEDIAEKLENLGYMKDLIRTRVNRFSIDNSVTLKELEENKDNKQFVEKQIIKIEEIFEKNDNITLSTNNLNRFLNGVQLNINKENGIYKIYNQKHEFIGIGTINNMFLKREIII